MSTVPVRKLSSPRRSFSWAVVNDVRSDWNKCDLLRKVSTFSISFGLCIVCYWSEGRERWILIQGIEVSSGISMNFIQLDCFCLVWCLMDRCIWCWCSMRIRLVKYITCFLLFSNLASKIRSFRKSNRSNREFFLIGFKLFVKVLSCCWLISYYDTCIELVDKDIDYQDFGGGWLFVEVWFVLKCLFLVLTWWASKWIVAG